MTDDKIILSAEEAISLLPEGQHIHNYKNPGAGLMLGIDFERADAEKHIRKAIQREIGGPGCQAMKHALVVWDTEKSLSFFETDMDKVSAMEKVKQAELASGEATSVTAEA